VDVYIKETRLNELSRRYASNVATGRLLWRNYDSSEEIEVRVDSLKQGASTQ